MITSAPSGHEDPRPVYVMGATSIGLGFTRSLGRKGIPVYVLDSRPLPPAMYSRYGSPVVLADIEENPEDWLDFLVKHGSKAARKPLLVPTGDAHVLLVSRYRALIEEHFSFNIPNAALVETLCDKRKQYECLEGLGVAVPKTICPTPGDDIPDLAAEYLGYPCLIKPVFAHSWRKNHAGMKVLQASTPKGLEDLSRRVRRLNESFITQEMIPGGDDNLYFYMSYVDKNGEPLAGFVARKLRQHPPFFGNGSLVISTDTREIEDISMSLLKKISYQGYVGVEFKWDHRCGQFKLIEINTRSVASIQHAVDCGIDFPYLGYVDLTGGRPERLGKYRVGAKFVHLAWDAQAFCAYRRMKRLSIASWLKSLKGVQSFAVYDPRDPGPFLSMGLRFLQKILRLALHPG